MIKIMARISSRADSASALGKILRDLVDPTRREPGCVSYDLFQNNDDPLEFVTIEHWTDQAAADAHLTAPHVVAAIANAGDLLAQPPAIHRYTRIS
ncbi:putative quinol monooxygenase [Undibacterium arcticum]|jgi:quinol monooxygenase YgiN